MSLMLFTGESREELLCLGVPIQNGPTGAAHTADGLEIFLEVLVILFLELCGERAVWGERRRASFELREIKLMQPHAIEFEGAAADKLRERMSVRFGILGVFDEFARYRIEIFDVPLVEADMLFDIFLRDAVERRDVELLCFVRMHAGSIPREIGFSRHLMGYIIWLMRRSSRIIGILALFLCALALGIWYAVLVEDRAAQMTVSFLDIGQGDAIFIDAPSGRQVLIDGGAGVSVLRQLSRVSPWWDRSIDIVIATHPDQDHIGGLIDVLRRYTVGIVVVSSVDGDTAMWSTFMSAAQEEKARLIIAERGQVIDIGAGAFVEVLFPDRNVPSIETNTGSIVTRVVYGDTTFMLTGDSPSGVEEYLAALDAERLHSNVLKAGHHGSKTSSSPAFVGFVAPEYVVYSRGCDNTYGHPSPETIATFERFNIVALDTCDEGTISFVSDGRFVERK